MGGGREEPQTGARNRLNKERDKRYKKIAKERRKQVGRGKRSGERRSALRRGYGTRKEIRL
jgi:hypothetical protein